MQRSLSCEPEEPKQVYKVQKLAMQDLHGLEVCSQFGATELELLDDVRYLLKPDQKDETYQQHSGCSSLFNS